MALHNIKKPVEISEIFVKIEILFLPTKGCAKSSVTLIEKVEMNFKNIEEYLINTNETYVCCS